MQPSRSLGWSSICTGHHFQDTGQNPAWTSLFRHGVSTSGVRPPSISTLSSTDIHPAAQSTSSQMDTSHGIRIPAFDTGIKAHETPLEGIVPTRSRSTSGSGHPCYSRASHTTSHLSRFTGDHSRRDTTHNTVEVPGTDPPASHLDRARATGPCDSGFGSCNGIPRRRSIPVQGLSGRGSLLPPDPPHEGPLTDIDSVTFCLL